MSGGREAWIERKWLPGGHPKGKRGQERGGRQTLVAERAGSGRARGPTGSVHTLVLLLAGLVALGESLNRLVPQTLHIKWEYFWKRSGRGWRVDLVWRDLCVNLRPALHPCQTEG